MEHYVGPDVSLRLTTICIVDRTGKIEREGEIVPGFAMLQESNRASHIDPPVPSYAIMRSATPTAERTLDPARMFEGELARKPGIRSSHGTAARARNAGYPRLVEILFHRAVTLPRHSLRLD